MLAFGVLQAATNLLYCALALAGKSYAVMVAAVVIEHVAGAMGGIALVEASSWRCATCATARFQYALGCQGARAAAAVQPRISGRLGCRPRRLVCTIYVMSFVLALPGLTMVYLTRRKIEALDRMRSQERP